MFIISAVISYNEYTDKIDKLELEKANANNEKIESDKKKAKDDSTRRVDDSIRSDQIIKLSSNLQKSDDILKSSNLNYEKIIALNKSTQIINTNLKNSIAQQKNLMRDQEWVQFQIMKLAYPLEPLTIYYVADYPFGNGLMMTYAQNIKSAIIYQLNLKRYNPWKYYTERDSLWEFNLTNDYPELLAPTKENKDFRESILTNNLRIQLNQSNGLEIVFLPITGKFGPIVEPIENITITLYVNFPEAKFTKVVKYEKPYRTGNDNLAISSVDLIGRTLKWDFISFVNVKLRKIGFQFKYDFISNTFERYINVDNYSNEGSPNPLIIKSSDLGIEEVLKSIDKTK
jgi:hypothetical protein